MGWVCKKVENGGCFFVKKSEKWGCFVKSGKLGCFFAKKWKMGVFCKNVENGRCFVKKVENGVSFLNAGRIMYSIGIFYFTFYLFAGGG